MATIRAMCWDDLFVRPYGTGRNSCDGPRVLSAGADRTLGYFRASRWEALRLYLITPRWLFSMKVASKAASSPSSSLMRSSACEVFILAASR